MERFHSTPAAKQLAQKIKSRKRGFGNLSGLTEHTQVNPDQLRTVMRNAKRGAERSVVSKIIADCVECQFDIRLVYEQNPIELAESDQQIINVCWPPFVKSALECIMVAGLVVVQSVGKRDTTYPRVIPFDLISIYFSETATQTRQYWVEDIDGGEVLDVLIFVRDQPDSSGNLTSCGASVMDIQARIERTRANQDDADYHRTHPTWVIGMNAKPIGIPDPNEHDQFAPGDLNEEAEDYLHGINQRNVTQVQKLEAWANRKEADLMDQVQRDVTQPALPTGVSTLPAWRRQYVMPANTTLITQPMPQLNSYLQQEWEMYERQVAQAYNVPAAIMDAAKGSMRVSAQSDIGFRQWIYTVRNLQVALVAFIRETYLYVNTAMLETYVKLFTSAAMQNRARLLEALQTNVRSKLSSKNKNNNNNKDSEDLLTPDKDVVDQALEEYKKQNRSKEGVREDVTPTTTTSRERDLEQEESESDDDSDKDDSSDNEDDDEDSESKPRLKKQRKESNNKKKKDKDSTKDKDEEKKASTPRPKPKSPAQSSSSILDNDEEGPELPQLFTNDEGNQQIGETTESLRRAAKLLSITQETIEAVMRAEIQVDVAFKMRPASSLEEMDLMYERQLITKDSYADLASNATGIPKTSMLIGHQDSLKDAKERKKLMDILMPPDENKDKDKPKAKPKPKPKPKPKSPASSASKPAAAGMPKPAEIKLSLSVEQPKK